MHLGVGLVLAHFGNLRGSIAGGFPFAEVGDFVTCASAIELDQIHVIEPCGAGRLTVGTGEAVDGDLVLFRGEGSVNFGPVLGAMHGLGGAIATMNIEHRTASAAEFDFVGFDPATEFVTRTALHGDIEHRSAIGRLLGDHFESGTAVATTGWIDGECGLAAIINIGLPATWQGASMLFHIAVVHHIDWLRLFYLRGSSWCGGQHGIGMDACSDAPSV